MSENYINYIRDVYNNTYELEIGVLSGSEAISDAMRLSARRKAIDKAFIESLVRYEGKVNQEDLWAAIADTHKMAVAGLDKYGLSLDEQLDVIHNSLSAHQSWIKSSGHAFERYISNTANDDLEKNEIRFVLQKELTQMIKGNMLSNTPEDIEGLNNWGKDFDLYAIQTIHGESHVFGCIQSKTSIRDRVGRDVGFSKNAMDGLFWSVAITFDGSFLNMPEFINMVNGGGSYTSNGWHGMYAFSGIDASNGRIYKTDKNLKIFTEHSIIAAKQFISDRRVLNNKWIAS